MLVEAISVVIRADRLLNAFNSDFEAFKAVVPNRTLCADDELVRVGFMSPQDTEAFVQRLEELGLAYLRDGAAVDLVVVDQQRGPMAPCDWLDFGRVEVDDAGNRVSAARLAGSQSLDVVTPEGWEFSESLSAKFGFVPNEHIEKGLQFLRREDGLDVYWNPLTKSEVFIGRADGKH